MGVTTGANGVRDCLLKKGEPLLSEPGGVFIIVQGRQLEAGELNMVRVPILPVLDTSNILEV